MSSSFTYTLTKLRSLPCSLYKCVFRPECLRVRSASSSPTVAPAASTASCLSVYGLSGVGMRIFAMIQTALFEARTIVFQKPHRHLGRFGLRDGNDDVRKRRPRVIEVVLRRPRRMIRMRMIEPEQLGADFGRAALGFTIVGRTHEKTTARPLFGRVRQRDDRAHMTVSSNERAAAFVRIRFLPVRTNGVVDWRRDRETTISHSRSRSSRSDTS